MPWRPRSRSRSCSLWRPEPGVAAGLAQQGLLLLHVDLGTVHAQVDLHSLVGFHSSTGLLFLSLVDGFLEVRGVEGFRLRWFRRHTFASTFGLGTLSRLTGAGSIDGSDEEPAPGSGSTDPRPAAASLEDSGYTYLLPLVTAAGAYSSASHRRPPRSEAFARSTGSSSERPRSSGLRETVTVKRPVVDLAIEDVPSIQDHRASCWPISLATTRCRQPEPVSLDGSQLHTLPGLIRSAMVNFLP